MARHIGDAREISLGDDLGDVAIRVNGVCVEISANGKVQLVPAVNDAAPQASTVKAEPEIGDVMKDGTIYAGISPETGKPMYAAPTDAPVRMDIEDAEKYAKKLEVGDKKDFRVPSKGELNVLFQNKEKGALKGTFNTVASSDTSSYWSTTRFQSGSRWGQKFSDGDQDFRYRLDRYSVRCIR